MIKRNKIEKKRKELLKRTSLIKEIKRKSTKEEKIKGNKTKLTQIIFLFFF
jgi:hypothetical protein